MRTHTTVRRSLAPLALALAAIVIIPAHALGKVLVRFIHAVPGVGPATVNLDTGSGMHPVGIRRLRSGQRLAVDARRKLHMGPDQRWQVSGARHVDAR